MRRTFLGRKLLVASVGVAAVSYVACTNDDGDPTSTDDGGSDDASQFIGISSSGNQMAPLPFDSGVDATDAADAGTEPDGADATAPSEASADATSDSPSDATDEGG